MSSARIRVRNVGARFGHVGEVVVRGRVLETTALVPWGMQHVAREQAVRIADELGLEVGQ